MSDSDTESIGSLRRSSSWSSRTDDTTSARGLANLGNTCYINAALQCIAHCSPLRKCVKEHKQHHVVYRLMTDVMKKMWSIKSGEEEVVSPDELVHACYENMSGVLTPRRQQDLSEFLMALLDIGSEMIRPSAVSYNNAKTPVDLMLAKIHTAYRDCVEAASPLAQCATLQTVAQMSCGACGKKEHRFEHSTMLYVPPLDREPLSRCIESAFECETKSDWKCDHCKRCEPSRLSRKLTVLPQVLIVAINRFNTHMSKVNHEVLVEYELDLSPHCILMPRSSTKRYRLVAMACHSGSDLHYGHYYAVAWCGNAWIRYDDECRDVETRNRGVSTGFKSRDAYLAFYTLEEA